MDLNESDVILPVEIPASHGAGKLSLLSAATTALLRVAPGVQPATRT